MPETKIKIIINNMIKKLLFIGLILFTISLSAQSLDEYKKKQQAEMQKFQQTHTEGTEQLQKKYADYVSKRDAEWADYLRKEWEMFTVFSGKKAPLKPKPDVVPAYVQDAVRQAIACGELRSRGCHLAGC